MTNKTIKKLSTILMALFVFVATLSFHTPVSATTNQVSFVALGDSISTGYGLPGYTPPTVNGMPYASESFVEVLNATENFTTTNFAVDGLTSTQLAAASNPNNMSEMQKQVLQNTTMISITIGGNDLLGAFYAEMGKQMGITVLDEANLLRIQNAIVIGASGIPGTEQTFWLTRALMSVAGGIESMAMALAGNLTIIIANLKTINPNARIVVQTIANPYKGLPNAGLVDILDLGVNAFNSIINSASIYLDYEVVDVYKAFNSSSEVLTNATNPNMPLDPHPNAAGHKVIANLLSEKVGHSFSKWETITAPTCLEGLQRRVCATCGSVEEQVLEATGHEWMKEFTVDEVATCTKEGFKSIHCLNCDEIKDRKTLPMIEHTSSDWMTDKAVTVDEEGLRHRECSVCKKVLEEQGIARLTKQPSFIDTTNGIKVEYADGSLFDINTKLVVTAVTKDRMDALKEDIQSIANGYSLISLYDINLMSGESAVQSNGNIKISIKLTEEMKAMKDLKVIFVDKNQKIEIVPHEIDGDHLVFTTDHLSSYGVIGTTVTSVQTRDSTATSMFVMLGLVSIGFILFIAKKKKMD